MNAVRALLDLDRPCKFCGEVNRPGAKPAITREPDDSLICSVCGKRWIPAKDDAA